VTDTARRQAKPTHTLNVLYSSVPSVIVPIGARQRTRNGQAQMHSLRLYFSPILIRSLLPAFGSGVRQV
jgi:hypothetical protein